MVRAILCLSELARSMLVRRRLNTVSATASRTALVLNGGKGKGAGAVTTAIGIVDGRLIDLVSAGMDAHCASAATTAQNVGDGLPNGVWPGQREGQGSDVVKTAIDVVNRRSDDLLSTGMGAKGSVAVTTAHGVGDGR